MVPSVILHHTNSSRLCRIINVKAGAGENQILLVSLSFNSGPAFGTSPWMRRPSNSRALDTLGGSEAELWAGLTARLERAGTLNACLRGVSSQGHLLRGRH